MLDGEDHLGLNLRDKQSFAKPMVNLATNRPADKSSAVALPCGGGLVDWASDIRGLITCADGHGVWAKRPSVRGMLSRWLAICHPGHAA